MANLILLESIASRACGDLVVSCPSLKSGNVGSSPTLAHLSPYDTCTGYTRVIKVNPYPANTESDWPLPPV